MTLLETVVVMMSLLSPFRSGNVPLAVAIADTVQAEEPLYQDDAARVKTAALLVTMAWHESRFDARAAGDCPGLPAGSKRCTLDRAASVGAFQQYTAPKAKEAFAADVNEQARVAVRELRASFRAARVCGSELGFYAAGPKCTSDRAKAISAWRMGEARALAKRVVQP